MEFVWVIEALFKNMYCSCRGIIKDKSRQRFFLCCLCLKNRRRDRPLQPHFQTLLVRENSSFLAEKRKGKVNVLSVPQDLASLKTLDGLR